MAEIIRYVQARVCPVHRDHVLEGPPAVERYSKEYVAPGRLSPEDVRQIVDALEQLDWVQWVKQMMARFTEAEAAGSETYARRTKRYGRPLRTLPEIAGGPQVQARSGEVPTVRPSDDDEDDRQRILRYAIAQGCGYLEAMDRLGIPRPKLWAGSQEHGRAVA